MDDRQRIGQDMDGKLSGDPQHPVPVLQDTEALVEKTHTLKDLPAHEGCAGPVKTLRGVEFPAPIRGIFPGEHDPTPVPAGKDVAGSDKTHPGMGPEVFQLNLQFSGKPLIIGIEAGDELPLRQGENRIPGRRGAAVPGKADNPGPGHQAFHRSHRVVGGGIVADEDFQFLDSLRYNTLQCASDAVGAVVGGDDDADQHDAGKIGEALGRRPSFSYWPCRAARCPRSIDRNDG